MRCPICDAKLESGILCKYCGVTKEQIESASNKKVKEYKKQDKSDLIYFTNVVPSDVSRVKLILFAIFLGLFGVHLFYVNRYKRGLYMVLSFPITLFFNVLSMSIPGFSGIYILQLMFEVSLLCFVISLIFWISDIMSIIFKGFKVPVVLGEKGVK